MPERDKNKPSGIANAAIEGAREGENQSKEEQARDAKVHPDQASSERTSENNEAPMGGAPVAFPAPSAQPTRIEPNEQRAKVDVEWTEEEDDNTEWQRAGGNRGPND